MTEIVIALIVLAGMIGVSVQLLIIAGITGKALRPPKLTSYITGPRGKKLTSQEAIDYINAANDVEELERIHNAVKRRIE